MQSQNCHGPLCTAQSPTYDLASTCISETTKSINVKFQDNIWTVKVCSTMQYCDVITNPRWRTAAILKIVKSPYLLEQELSYCKQIAHQLRTQFVEGISVTLTSTLRVTQSQWKRNHWTDHTRLTVRRVIGR